MAVDLSILDEPEDKGVDLSVLDSGVDLSVLDEDPSGGQIAAGLATEIAISEGAKWAGAAAGSFIPVIGTGVGYVLGALGGGAAGSIAAQRMEGRDELSYGRIVADSLINLIPASKAAKGAGLAARAGSAALRQGAAGAVIAPAAQVIESAVEGEDISADQLLVTSGVGAALGAGLGISGEAASALYKRFAKATPEQIENAIFSGDKDAIKLLDKAMQDVDLPEGTPRQEIGRLAKLKARYFPSTATGAEVQEIAKEAKDTISASRSISRLSAEVLDGIKKKLPEESREAYDEAIGAMILKRDDSLLKSMNLNKKDFDQTITETGLITDEVSRLQQKLLDGHNSGARTLPESLVNNIEKQKRDGGYLSRRYKMFDEEGYVPSKQQVDDAVDEMVSVGQWVTDNQKWKKVTTKQGKEIKVKNKNFGKQIKKDVTREDAENYLTSMLDKRKDPDAVHAFLIGGNTPKGVLKPRKNLDDMPALRSFLGEEHSAVKRAEATIDSLAKITAYDEADSRIKKALDDMGLLSTGGVDPNTEQLKLKSGIVREGDESYRIPKDVAIALDQSYNVGMQDASTNPVANTMRDVWSAGVALAKGTKVLYNPPSYMVQPMGNLANLVGMGMNPLKGLGKGIKAGAMNFDTIAKRQGKAARQLHRRLIELDLVPPSATVADINKGLEGLAGRVAGKALEVPGKAYSLADTAGRIVAFENHKNLFKRAIPDLPENKLEEVAAFYTNRVYQNYNYVPETLKQLNKYGVLGQFAAFTQELMRNQYNQGKMIKDMTTGKMARELSEKYGYDVNPSVLRKDGVKRLAALTAMYGGIAASINQFNRQTVSKEEEEAYRRTEAAPWDKERSLILFKDGDTIKSINASYIVPHMQLWGAAESAMRGESFDEAMLKGAGSLWADLGGEGDFIYNALVPAVQGKRLGSDKPISEKPSGLGEKFDRTKFFFNEAFQPGIYREYKKATDKELKQTPKTTALRQLGIRINEKDIGDGAYFKIKDAKNRMKLGKSEFNKERVKTGDTSNYNAHNANYRENFQIMVNAAQDLKTLGLTEDEVIAKMKAAGMSTIDALHAIDGNVQDMPMASTNPAQDAWDAIENLPKKERIKAIYNTQNREIRDSLMRRHRADVTYSAKGYSARDVALKGMDNGQKVRYIRSKPNPSGIARDLRRRGLISDAVYKKVLQSE